MVYVALSAIVAATYRAVLFPAPRSVIEPSLSGAELLRIPSEPGEVVALEPQPGATGQSRPPFERRRERCQPRPGEMPEHVHMVSDPMWASCNGDDGRDTRTVSPTRSRS